MINFSVNDQTAAHTAAQRHVEYRIELRACTERSFAQRAHIRVVVHKDGGASQTANPSRKIKTRPAFDLVGAGNPAGTTIYRTTETDADRGDVPRLVEEFRKCAFDLLADASGAERAVNLEAKAFESVPRLVTRDALQLRPANFDAENH